MIYMFLANGMEEVEALCPLDIMRRAGLEVLTVGIGGREITGSHGITVLADIGESEMSDFSPEMIFLPGGMPGTLNLAASETVRRAVTSAAERGAYIAAICAAPSILGDMGLLVGKHAVCFPGFEDRLKGAVIPSCERVVKDGNIITAAGMGAALELGLKIVETFFTREKAEELRHAIIAD